MIIREVKLNEKPFFNQAVVHPLQSWEWGEFREESGLDLVRIGQFEEQKLINAFSISFHKVPKFDYTIAYIPKSILPNEEMFQALRDLGKVKKTIFFKLEPNVFEPEANERKEILEKARKIMFDNGCRYGKALFTKYSFILDLSKSEEELMAQMKQKTRYNVKVAEKNGVVVTEDNSDEALADYLRLTFEETTVRQGFYAHNREYHKRMFKKMHEAGIAHLFKAVYNGETLVTWIVFTFGDVLYYPYGASSSKFRNLMASNLMMWEVIKYGKKMGLKYFDMWGSLGPEASKRDSWYGFHKFKEGYSPTLCEFAGTFDLVLDEGKYNLYQKAEKWRWKVLKLKSMLGL